MKLRIAYIYAPQIHEFDSSKSLARGCMLYIETLEIIRLSWRSIRSNINSKFYVQMYVCEGQEIQCGFKIWELNEYL